MCIFSSIHEYWLRGYDILTFAMNRVKHFTTKDWYMVRVISHPIDIQVLEDLNLYVTNQNTPNTIITWIQYIVKTGPNYLVAFVPARSKVTTF